MGFDMSDLARFGPAAQQQILRQLGREALKKQKGSKYHARATERVTGSGNTVTFGSKLEAERYDQLMLLLKAGKIADLKLQPEFTLQQSYKTPEGERIRAIKYVADFSYIISDGLTSKLVVEDTKSEATKTPQYRMKYKMMQSILGIKVTEIMKGDD